MEAYTSYSVIERNYEQFVLSVVRKIIRRQGNRAEELMRHATTSQCSTDKIVYTATVTYIMIELIMAVDVSSKIMF